MINIIFLLLAGSLLTYISKYNLMPVTVNLGIHIIENIPLFYVIVGSLLSGLILSYLMQLLSSIFTYFEIKAKSRQIKSDQAEILDLTKTVHQLQLQNEKLKHSEPEDGDPLSL